MAKTKVTNKEMYGILADIVYAVGIPEGVESSVTADELIDWIEIKTEQLTRKATTMTKKQKETAETNKALLDKILPAIEAAENGITVTDIMKTDEAFADYSNQKITALLRKAISDGLVSKEKVGGKTLYRIGGDAE
jgi:hypothetical protein